MTPKKQQSKKGKGSGALLLSAAIAAALAAGAGYYATHKEEVDKEAKKRINDLAKAFKETKKEVEKRVNEVWGEVSDEAVAIYMDVRGGLVHALEEENLAKTGKMIRKKYDELVDYAVKEARKSGILDKDVEERLSELFKMDWNDVQAILSSSAKRMAGEVKKEAKKAATQVRRRAKAKSKKSATKKKTPSKKKTTARKSSKTTSKKPVRKTAARKTKKK